MERYLKKEFRFNASHCNVNDPSKVHSHTFIVSIYTDYVDARTEIKLVSAIEYFLYLFTGKNLNELDYFEGNYPSIEEMGDRFFESLNNKFKEFGVNLYELGIADGPMATYYVSDRIMLPNINDNISRKNYDLVTKLIERINQVGGNSYE